MKNRDAYIIYLTVEGLFSLFFYTIITVNMVYQVEVAKLNPLQLVLVGTMLEATALIFQVPTGVFADVLSRRLSIIIGMFLTGAGFILEGSIPRFETILISQLGWGIGSSFISGAEEAWISNELGDEHIGKIYLRGSQVSQVAALIGAIISVSLASIRLNLPIILGGVLFLALGIFLLFFMPEHNFRRSSRERGLWKAMGKTLLDGGRQVRGSPILITILCIALFYGLYSEGVDRLWTAHLLTDFTLPTLGPLKPVVWFAAIRGGVMVLSLAATEIVLRRLNTSDNTTLTRLLMAMNTLQISMVIAFGLAGNFASALITFWGFSTLRGMIIPLYTTWITQHTDSQVRATIISLSGQVDAVGQIAGGPVIGVIGTLVSLRAAIVAAGTLLAPSLPFFVRALRQGKKDNV